MTRYVIYLVGVVAFVSPMCANALNISYNCQPLSVSAIGGGQPAPNGWSVIARYQDQVYDYARNCSYDPFYLQFGNTNKDNDNQVAGGGPHASFGYSSSTLDSPWAGGTDFYMESDVSMSEVNAYNGDGAIYQSTLSLFFRRFRNGSQETVHYVVLFYDSRANHSNPESVGNDCGSGSCVGAFVSTSLENINDRYITQVPTSSSLQTGEPGWTGPKTMM